MKLRTNVTIEEEIVEWIDQQVKEKKFQNRSNAIEHYLRKANEDSKKSNQHDDMNKSIGAAMRDFLKTDEGKKLIRQVFIEED